MNFRLILNVYEILKYVYFRCIKINTNEYKNYFADNLYEFISMYSCTENMICIIDVPLFINPCDRT